MKKYDIAVIGGGFAGVAAAIAAAIASKSGIAVNNVDIKSLQASLKANGAFLGI